MEKKCPECKKPVYGRTDKRYCSDACRNAYNNKINASVNNRMRTVNNLLAKNRRILCELNPAGKKKIHKDQLLRKGFDFNFFTSSYETRTGDVYRFCYEHGYLMLDEGFILLVERKEEN